MWDLQASKHRDARDAEDRRAVDPLHPDAWMLANPTFFFLRSRQQVQHPQRSHVKQTRPELKTLQLTYVTDPKRTQKQRT